MNVAARHSWLFATQFFAFGIVLPFLPAVLAARGLDAAEVAAVLALGSAVRLVAGPAGGWAADALGAPRLVLACAAAASALAACGLLLLAGFVAMLAVHAVLSAAMAPIVPLTDAVTTAAIRGARFDYGRVRAAGSVAFILAALLGGQAVARFGVDGAVALMVLGCAGAAVAALLLPAAPQAVVGRPRGLAAFTLPLRIPAFRRLLLVSALVQSSHAFYYAFGTLHWQAAGLGAGLIGALWATGVVAEIALFVWGRGLVLRLGPVGLSLLAAGCGVLRWGVTAVTADPWLLFPAQVLHAGTFGAQHLATMAVLGRVVPVAQAGTAQTVHAALGPGLAMGVLTLACGPLYEGAGGGGFWAMALLCAAAVPASIMLGRALSRA
ncbi:MFS transporter [Falsiroseomonas sp. CW058]|uniref:MFS transporter n=1 Tax=Falsiroseomonas sp. CW058 TaxID=3388664 RepID=UPI003D31CE8B